MAELTVKAKSDKLKTTYTDISGRCLTISSKVRLS